jgi:hypothetical protein
MNYIITNFKDFLNESITEITEEKGPGTPIDPAGAKTLVDLIVSKHSDLAYRFYSDKDTVEKAGSISGPIQKSAAEELNSGNPAKAGLYSLLKKAVAATETEIPLFTAMGLGITKENYRDSKNVKAARKSYMDKLASMKEEDAKKILVESLKVSPANPFPSGMATPILWSLLSQDEKNKVYTQFMDLAKLKKYDSVEGLQNVIEKHYKAQRKDDSARMQNPGVVVSLNKEEMKMDAPAKPGKVVTTYAIKPEKEHEVFKPNMWGSNGAEDYMEDTLKDIIENLTSIFQRYSSGEVKRIISVSIQTSADRYRNTGQALNLSWGQLAYARAISMAKLVLDIAKENGIPDGILSEINSKIKIDISGSNGDGTSGPNAPAPLQFGYYITKGGKTTWIQSSKENERGKIQIVEMDDKGTPIEGKTPKSMDMPTKTDKKDYNEYRYNNILIEYEEGSKQPVLPEASTPDKVINLSYPTAVRLPGRYSSTTIRIPLPSISIGRREKSTGGGKPTSCPDLTKSNIISIPYLQFKIKQVEVAKFVKDATR